MKRPVQNDIVTNTMKVAKRIAITILCTIPFIIVFAYLTRNIITNNVLQILCFIAIMGITVLIEEIIVRKKENRKKEMEILSDNQDVFK